MSKRAQFCALLSVIRVYSMPECALYTQAV